MRKCPYCVEEIQDDAIKCRYCGEATVSDEWRRFCAEYATKSASARNKEWAKLSEDQKSAFSATWKALGYDKPLQQVSEHERPATANVLAAIASFFIPGLGQLAQGRIGTAILMFVAASLLWLLWLGWVVHLTAAIDAARW